jgi:hypothetical protein
MAFDHSSLRWFETWPWSPASKGLPPSLVQLRTASGHTKTLRCARGATSRRYLRKSFPGCLDPYPGGTPWCIHPFLPIEHRPSPHIYWVGSHTNRIATSLRGFISGLQSFRHVQAPRFAHHPGRSYRSLDLKAGQPRLLHPSISRFVALPCPGYASRQNRAIDDRGLSPP